MKKLLLFLFILSFASVDAQKAPTNKRAFRPDNPGTFKGTDASGNVGDIFPAVQSFIPSRLTPYQIGDLVSYNGQIYEAILQTTTAPDDPVVTPPGPAWVELFKDQDEFFVGNDHTLIEDHSYSWWVEPLSFYDKKTQRNYFSTIGPSGGCHLHYRGVNGESKSVKVFNITFGKDEHNSAAIIKMGDEIVVGISTRNSPKHYLGRVDMELNITSAITDKSSQVGWTSSNYTQFVIGGQRLFMYTREAGDFWSVSWSDDRGDNWTTGVDFIEHESAAFSRIYQNTTKGENLSHSFYYNNSVNSAGSNYISLISHDLTTGEMTSGPNSLGNFLTSTNTPVSMGSALMQRVYDTPLGYAVRLLDATAINDTIAYVAAVEYLETDYDQGAYFIIEVDLINGVALRTIPLPDHGHRTYLTYVGGVYFMEDSNEKWNRNITLTRESEGVWFAEIYSAGLDADSFELTAVIDTVSEGSTYQTITRFKPPVGVTEGGFLGTYQKGTYAVDASGSLPALGLPSGDGNGTTGSGNGTFTDWDNEIKIVERNGKSNLGWLAVGASTPTDLSDGVTIEEVRAEIDTTLYFNDMLQNNGIVFDFSRTDSIEVSGGDVAKIRSTGLSVDSLSHPSNQPELKNGYASFSSGSSLLWDRSLFTLSEDFTFSVVFDLNSLSDQIIFTSINSGLDRFGVTVRSGQISAGSYDGSFSTKSVVATLGRHVVTYTRLNGEYRVFVDGREAIGTGSITSSTTTGARFGVNNSGSSPSDMNLYYASYGPGISRQEANRQNEYLSIEYISLYQPPSGGLSAAGDNLGNHTAAQALDMGGFQITNAVGALTPTGVTTLNQITRGIFATTTTDLNGLAIIPHTFGQAPTAVTCGASGPDFRLIQSTSTSATQVVVKAFNSDGTPYVGLVSIHLILSFQ